jgi:hypothetical protein
MNHSCTYHWAEREGLIFGGPRRYHKGLDNVTPYDLNTGRHLEIIRRMKEVESKTLAAGIDYNKTPRRRYNL